MIPINLTFEVDCYQPSWVKYIHMESFQTVDTESKYRIYVNDDLITERNWIWTWNNILLCENIWVYTNFNSIYTLKLYPVLYNAAQAKFRIQNLKIDNVLNDIKPLSDLQIEYKIINTL